LAAPIWPHQFGRTNLAAPIWPHRLAAPKAGAAWRRQSSGWPPGH
jgi:hypothetical protein